MTTLQRGLELDRIKRLQSYGHVSSKADIVEMHRVLDGLLAECSKKRQYKKGGQYMLDMCINYAMTTAKIIGGVTVMYWMYKEYKEAK